MAAFCVTSIFNDYEFISHKILKIGYFQVPSTKNATHNLHVLCSNWPIMHSNLRCYTE